MILSDRDILKKIDQGEIGISSADPDYRSQVHASSMDLRLGNHFKVYNHSQAVCLDPMNMESFSHITKVTEVKDGKPFFVQSNEFVLGVTKEKITLPDDLVARVEGRSSLGRLGIVVHSTAGFIDPGFSGTITLEISNLNRLPVALYPGMRVCQLAFETMSSRAAVPYHQKKCSKYQNQVLPEESRICLDNEFKKGNS